MRLVCTHFDYKFRLHGREGGLNETRWIFEPLPDRGDGSAEIRDGLLAAADFHGELLDRVFARVLKGGRQPVLSGSEDRGGDGFAVTSGHQYAGRLTWTGRRLLRRRLERLFGEAAFPVRRGASPDGTFYADTGLRFSGKGRPSGLHLWVSHKLPPAVNACLFCQSALKFDPRSACNIDPPEWHGGGCPGSQQGGPARLRVAPCATRSEAAWGVPVGPPGQPGRGDGRRRVRSGS